MSSTIHFQEILPKLSIETLNAINEFGYSVATPVQASTIPLFLSYKDVLCEAVTGSGKSSFILYIPLDSCISCHMATLSYVDGYRQNFSLWYSNIRIA